MARTPKRLAPEHSLPPLIDKRAQTPGEWFALMRITRFEELRSHIVEQLHKHGGNVTKTAAALNLNRSTLTKWLGKSVSYPGYTSRGVSFYSPIGGMDLSEELCQARHNRRTKFMVPWRHNQTKDPDPMAYREQQVGLLLRIDPDKARELVVDAHIKTHGNITQAAILLGVSRRNLVRWILRLDLRDQLHALRVEHRYAQDQEEEEEAEALLGRA